MTSFDRGGKKLIVAGLTSNVTTSTRFWDAPIQHWQKAGLVKPTAIRGVVMTVDEFDVARRMGVLDPVDFEKLEASIAEVLGFQIV